MDDVTVTPGDAGRAAERRGTTLALAASLVWPVQAAVIAQVLAALLTGGNVQPLASAAGFLALAALRAGLDMLAAQALSAAADARLTELRARVVAGETAAAAPSALGGAGAVAALAAEKAEAIRPYLLRYGPAKRRAMAVPLVILAIALAHGWAIPLVLVVAGPLIPVFMALVGRAAKEASERQMVEVGALSDLLVDRLAALADLRLIGAGPRVVAGFADASDSLRDRTMAVLRVAFLSSTVLELFAALGVAMVAVWTGFSLLGVIHWGTWGGTLAPFAGLWLLLLAPEYFQPLRDLAAAWHDKAAAEAVLKEAAAWHEDDRPRLPGHGHAAPPPAPGLLTLTNVLLARGERRIPIPDLSLAPGEAIAITGPSGVGKTTLLRVLAGLDLPADGTVTLGDTVLEDSTAEGWRAQVGWMPQAPHFLGRSLRWNVGFGAPLDPDLMARSQLDPVLASLPGGDLTPLGERGAGLSGGEARRVMLARALHSRPALLIADEPTADLDAATAEAVSEGLLAHAAAGGTLIVATHDAGLAARMNRVLTLEPAT